MLLFIISMVIGGSAWHDNDPRKDGDDGTSFISPDGEMYLEPLKGNTRFFSCVPNNALYTRVEPDTRLKRVSGTDKALLPSTSIIQVIRVNICARIE